MTVLATEKLVKVVHPGDVLVDGGRVRRSPIFCKIEFDGDRFSVSGVIGPLKSGNATGSCGQIAMGFAHRDPGDDDRRYQLLYWPEDIRFAPGWNAERWLDFLDIWKRWHLNMRAECEHQRALGWSYDEHHGNNPEAPYEGDACPECGYHIGSAWLTETVPDQAIEFVRALPDADRQPNWV